MKISLILVTFAVKKCLECQYFVTSRMFSATSQRGDMTRKREAEKGRKNGDVD